MLVIFWLGLTLFAQGPAAPGGDPVADGGGTGGTGGAGVPLDGGILSVLLAAGIGYVVAKKRKKKGD